MLAIGTNDPTLTQSSLVLISRHIFSGRAPTLTASPKRSPSRTNTLPTCIPYGTASAGRAAKVHSLCRRPPRRDLPSRHPVAELSGLLEEPVGVAAEELLCRLRLKALPGQDVVDRVGELALRMRVVGGVHQNVVTEEMGDVIEHILPFMVL